ncbi:SpoIIE family protein phosphatase [bacterium]|nr:SpoIIE family protein phosphatase [bacterium]
MADSARTPDLTDASSVSPFESKLEELARLSVELLRQLRSNAIDPKSAAEYKALAAEVASVELAAELQQELERERDENAILQTVSLKLSSAGELRDVLRVILESLAQVVEFDAAGIFVYDREFGQIEVDMLSGYEAAQRKKLYEKFQESVRSGEGIVATVVLTGRPIYVPDVRTDSRYVEVRPSTHSEIAVPIAVRGELIGAFNLESDHVDNFSERDRKTLQTFASHAGVALERARADRMRQHTRRIEEELALARRIHSTFLPKTMPLFQPYDLGGMNFPSSEVGGDYFDFVPITESDLGVIMSDVAGHGVAAALLMANFRACILIESRAHYAIRTILSRVNEFLVETNPPDSFVTAFYGVLNRERHILTYSNAGHNPPLLLRKGETPRQLSAGGPILGVFPGVEYEEAHVQLQAGDLLVFYTDGVTEAENSGGEQFGVERLSDAAKRYATLPAYEIARRISHDVHEFQAQDENQDDLTLSIVKYE